MNEAELKKALIDISHITESIKLSESTKVKVEELTRKAEEYTALLKEYKTIGFVNFMKKKKLKNDMKILEDEITLLLKIVAKRIADDLIPYLKKLDEYYHRAKDIVGPTFSHKKISINPSITDTFKLIEHLREVAAEAMDFEERIRKTVYEIVYQEWRSNNLKYNTYRKYLSFDVDKVPLSALDSFVAEDLDNLIRSYAQLKEEAKYLDALKSKVRESFQAVLLSRLNNLEAYIATIEQQGIPVEAPIRAKLNSLRKTLTEEVDLSMLQSLEKEVNELEDRIRAQLKRAILTLRNQTISESQDIPDLPPAPVISGESIDKLIETYQETKTWRSRVLNSVLVSINETLKVLEANINNLDPPLNQEITGIVMETKDKIASVATLPEAISIYKNLKASLDKWKSTIVSEITNLYAEYNSTLKLIREVLTHIPPELNIRVPENPVAEDFASLVATLSNIKSKIEQRDAVFRNALISELESIKNKILDIMLPYRDQFSSIVELIDTTIARIRQSRNTEEIRINFLRTKAEAEKEISNIIQDIREKMLLKTRLALAKLPNPPDLSEPLNEIQRAKIRTDAPDETIKQIVTIYSLKIISTLKDTLFRLINDFLEVLEKVEIFGVIRQPEKERLENLLETLNKTEDLEKIGDVGREFRNIITSPELVTALKNWINIMTTQMARALSSFRPDIAEVDTIKTLISESKSVDVTDVESFTTTANKIIKVWDLVRTYIVKLEELEYEKFLESAHSYEHYDLIEKIYERHKKEFSEQIYPLLSLEELREKFKETVTPEIVDFLTEIRRLEAGWLSKLKEIEKWHKVTRVLLSGFDFSLPLQERKSKLKEIKKKIKKTYTRSDVATYLTWLVEYLVETGGVY